MVPRPHAAATAVKERQPQAADSGLGFELDMGASKIRIGFWCISQHNMIGGTRNSKKNHMCNSACFYPRALVRMSRLVAFAQVGAQSGGGG